MPQFNAYDPGAALAGTEILLMEQLGVTLRTTPNALKTFITYVLPVASGGAIGGVKSGTDISVDGAGNVSVLNDSHTHDWGNVTSTPTTIGGYGIIDAVASLEDLSDTGTFGALIDGQVLTYDSVNGWQNEAAGTGVTDHTLLTNIGTNTHAAIDIHLALVNEHLDWTTAPAAAFNSLGIRDIATDERLSLANSELTLGSAAAPFTIAKIDNLDRLFISGGPAGSIGANLSLNSAGYSIPYDITFRSNSFVELLFDYSENLWDFRINDMATTGDIFATNTDAHMADTTLHFTKDSITLNDLSGVINSFPTLTDGQVLTYDSTNGWQNETSPAGVTDHVLLSNIGTNTHAQIDTHLALVNEHLDWTLGQGVTNIHTSNSANEVLNLSAAIVTQLVNIATTIISAANWTGVSNLAGPNTGDNPGLVTATVGVGSGLTVFSTSSSFTIGTDFSTLGLVVDVEGTDWLVARRGTTGFTHAISGIKLSIFNDDLGYSTNHQLLSNIGTNSHVTIDTHLADATIHFTKGSVTLNDLSGVRATFPGLADGHVLTYDTINGWQNESFEAGVTDHTLLTNIGTNTHAQIDTHLADGTTHFIKSSIALTDLSDVINTFSGLLDGQVLTYDTTNGWQNETSTTGVTDHLLLSNIGTNTHVQIDTHLALTDEHIDWTNAVAGFFTRGMLTVERNSGPGVVISQFGADLGVNTRYMKIIAPETDSLSDPFIFFTNNSFLFRIDATDALTIDIAGKVGINNIAPTAILDIIDEAGFQYKYSRYANNSNPAISTLYKSRGTATTPIVSNPGDIIGKFISQTKLSTIDDTIGELIFSVPSLSGDVASGQFDITLNDTSGALQTRLTIGETGRIEIPSLGGENEGIQLGNIGFFPFGTSGVEYGNATFQNQFADPTNTVFRVLPKGGGLAEFDVFNTDFFDDASNWENFKILANGVDYILGSNKAGTGVALPIQIRVGDNANQFYLATDGRVGINETVPGAQFQVSSIGGITAVFQRSANDASPANVRLATSRGTIETPLAVDLGDQLGNLNFAGYRTTGYISATAAIRAAAMEDFTDTAGGTDMYFQTTDLLTSTLVERMRITHDGKVSIGTALPQAKLHVQMADLSVPAGGAGDIAYFEGAATTDAYVTVLGDAGKKLGIRLGEPHNKVLVQMAWDGTAHDFVIGVSADGTANPTDIMTIAGADTTFAGTVSGSNTPITVRKSADETVNNSSTLQDDNHLVLAVDANTDYKFEVVLHATSDNTPGLKVGWTVPASATMWWAMGTTTTKLSESETHSQLGGGAIDVVLVFKGVIAVAGTAGNLQLQWAQDTQDVSDTIVYENSTLTLERLV